MVDSILLLLFLLFLNLIYNIFPSSLDKRSYLSATFVINSDLASFYIDGLSSLFKFSFLGFFTKDIHFSSFFAVDISYSCTYILWIYISNSNSSLFLLFTTNSILCFSSSSISLQQRVFTIINLGYISNYSPSLQDNVIFLLFVWPLFCSTIYNINFDYYVYSSFPFYFD